jgi:hypothetical protein
VAEPALKHFKHLFVTPPRDIYNYSNNERSKLMTISDKYQVKYDAAQDKYLTTRSMDTYLALKTMKMPENNLIGQNNRKVIRLSR